MFASTLSYNDDATPNPADRMTMLRELLDGLHRSSPLAVVIERTAHQIQLLLDVDGVSIWLREDGRLRCAAGCGLLPVRDQVALGAGPIGLCAATRAPVYASGQMERLARPAVSTCDREQLFRVAAPVLVEGDARAVVLIENQGVPIPDHDAEVLLALTAGIAGAIRADDARREAPEGRQARRAGGGTRRVVLRGRSFLPGQALGPIAALRRTPRRFLSSPPEGATRAVREAFDVARQSVRDLADQARHRGLGREAGFLAMYEAMLEDDRFCESAVDRVACGMSIHEAFDRLAREAIRFAALAPSSDEDAQQRSSDAEDLFFAVGMLAQDDRRARPHRACVLVGETLTPYDVLVSARSKPVGVVLTHNATEGRSQALIQLMGVPALLGVGGVNRWVSDGDIALLDATRGFVLLNPTRTEVAALREARRAG